MQRKFKLRIGISVNELSCTRVKPAAKMGCVSKMYWIVAVQSPQTNNYIRR